ncbi:MAG: HEPN domain-containing protein [Egibacteraceae bacterium]
MIAEQAAQLAVKGLLHGVGRGDRARGHDLVRLLDAAADTAGLAVSDEVREAAVRLSRHYQPTRYPDALPGGTPHSRYQAEDATVARIDADRLVDAVDEARAALREAAKEEP